MRGRVSLVTRDVDFLLPYTYPYHLASAIYHSLAKVSPEMAAELHDRRGFKFFTFSWLQVPRRRAESEGLRVLSRHCRFYISSPDEQLFHALMRGLLETPMITLNGRSFEVQGIGVLPPEPVRPGDWFSTLSPIMLRVSIDRRSLGNGESGGEGGPGGLTGQKRPKGGGVWDVLPGDPRFGEQLARNLVHKYEAFQGVPPQGTLSVLEVRRGRPKRMSIRGTWHRVAHMVLRLGGNSELIRFGYEVGLGERNSLGFGMIHRIDKPPAEETEELG